MIRIILRRLFDMFVGCFGLSALLAYVNKNSYQTSITASVIVFFVFTLLIFYIYNGYTMLKLYLRTNDSFDYYLYNVICIAVFIIIETFFWITMNQKIYIWLFSVTNIFYYMIPSIGSAMGTVLFYIMFFVFVIFTEKFYDRKFFGK